MYKKILIFSLVVFLMPVFSFAQTTTDSTPPVISGISVTNLTSNSGTIIWTTNEPADGQVQFVIGGPCPGTTNCLTPVVPTLNTFHAINVSGLLPSTTYTYVVKSRDAAGNLATSTNQTFTTTSSTTPAYIQSAYTVTDTTPPVISGISTSQITSTSALIGWTTNELSDSQVEFIGLCPSVTNCLSPVVTTPALLHFVLVTGLSPSTTYTYRVKSKDAAGNLAVSTNQTFTTLAKVACLTCPYTQSSYYSQSAYTPVLDITRPYISLVSASSITQTSAIIKWTTNELADSQVEFCLTYARCGNNTPLVPDLTLSHAINLSGLNPNTFYFYWVKSKDAAGNLSISYARYFRTLPVPDLTPPTVSITAPLNGATVSGTVVLSATAADNVRISSVKFFRNGVLINQDSYAPYSIYFYTSYLTKGQYTITAVARDTSGNETTSTPVVINVVPAVKILTSSITSITQTSATINWTTNELSDSQVEFCTTFMRCGNNTPLVPEMVTSHSINLLGLTPNTIYYAWLKSKDATGKTAILLKFFRTFP